MSEFQLFVNQLATDVKNLSSHITNIFALIGVCYAVKFSFKSCVDFCQNALTLRSLVQSKNFAKIYGRWAVITGSTSGIGEAFAMELASKGMNIVLVGRNEEKLTKVSKVIETNFGVHVMMMKADLEKFDKSSWDSFYKMSQELEIGILINNAGIHYDYPELFHRVDYAVVDSLCQVNMSGAVKLTHAILPGMIERKRGLIVNLSSSAGMIHSPMISLYSASKTFVDHFSQSLYHEVKPYNIHVQSLTPMYVSTRMTSYSSFLRSSPILTPNAKTYAKSAVTSFGWYRSNTGYIPHTIQCWIINKVPRNMAVWVGHRLQKYLHRAGVESAKNK